MQTTMMTFLFLQTLLANSSQQGAMPESPRLDPSIVQTAQAYLRAMLAGDAAAVTATYSDDARLLPPCGPPLEGRAAIEQYYRQQFQGPLKITEFTFSYWEAQAAGDSGYTAGTYKMKLAGGPAGSIEDQGKFVVIVKRTGGVWKAAFVIYNSDFPPPVPAASH